MKRLSFISFVLSAFLLIGFVACEPINPEVPSVDSGGTSSDSTSVDNGSGGTSSDSTSVDNGSGGTDITNPNDDIVKSGYVDLGLSVKWAAANVGADTPEGYGDFYDYDEAISKFGNNLPTKEQLQEFEDKCTWEWITYKGINGWKVTGPNGKRIFLPAAGYHDCNENVDYVGKYGYYWSFTPDKIYNAWNLFFTSDQVSIYNYNRCSGLSVRLVQGPDVIYTIIFNANGGSGTMSALRVKEGASQKLTANSFTRSGYTFTGWNTKADGSGTSYTNGQTITPMANLTLYAQWEAISNTTAGHDWVDLGLSVKWATTNVGASKPEGYGTLYTYEEAQERLWTYPWRTPTIAELDELKNKCTWEWTTQNGVSGCKVTGPNGKSIFLPAAGFRNYLYGDWDFVGMYGYYWSSSLHYNYTRLAWYLQFHWDGLTTDYSYPDHGCSVRLVLD